MRLRRKPGSVFPIPVVRRAWRRAEARCERCGQALRWEDRGYGWSAQHRAARGMGGTRIPKVTVDYCAILCGSGVTGCHGNVETQQRAVAYLHGWALRTGLTPDDHPVLHWQLGWVRLTGDGGYELVEAA